MKRRWAAWVDNSFNLAIEKLLFSTAHSYQCPSTERVGFNLAIEKLLFSTPERMLYRTGYAEGFNLAIEKLLFSTTGTT